MLFFSGVRILLFFNYYIIKTFLFVLICSILKVQNQKTLFVFICVNIFTRCVLNRKKKVPENIPSSHFLLCWTHLARLMSGWQKHILHDAYAQLHVTHYGSHQLCVNRLSVSLWIWALFCKIDSSTCTYLQLNVIKWEL